MKTGQAAREGGFGGKGIVNVWFGHVKLQNLLDIQEEILNRQLDEDSRALEEGESVEMIKGRYGHCEIR